MADVGEGRRLRRGAAGFAAKECVDSVGHSREEGA